MSAMAIAAEVPAPDKQPTVKVKGACERCGRVAVLHSRKGYTWRCPVCKFVNLGPGYHGQDRTPPEGTRRRIARRDRAAEQRTERAADGNSLPSPPAPVRRKRSSAQAGGVKEPAAAPAAVDAPSQGAPASPRRRGFLDRVLYGEGDE